MARTYRLPFMLAVLGAAVLASLASGPAHAQSTAAAAGVAGSEDADMPDAPIPSEAGEGFSPIGDGFTSPIKPRASVTPKPHSAAEKKPPVSTVAKTAPGGSAFIRDTELDANSRTYWLNLHGFDNRNYEALTSGGYLSYESGFVGDVLQLRAVVYTTQPLYAPRGAGRTLSLTPAGDQITTLGQANARLKFPGHELIVGRELIRTAFLNPKDNRMIPLSFEGVVLLPERRDDRKLDYIASYLTRWKPQITDEFISFAAPFGVRRDEGMLITGARHKPGNFNYGAINYLIPDTLNTTYGELDYLLPFGGGGDGPSYRVSVNDLDQRSVGADLIDRRSFNTYQISARLIASYRGFVLTGATSSVGREAAIRDPFGNIPAFTSLHQSAFERAGEDAYVATLSYDFTRVGIEGLRFLVGYGRGNAAINAMTKKPIPDRNVLNLRLEYEPLEGKLKGLQVYLYYADQDLIDAPLLASDDQRQFRAVVNYLVPLR